MTPKQQKNAILEGLADGKSLRTICKERGMPNISTVMRWCGDDEIWREQYAQARAQGDDAMAEDIQEIADRDDLEANDKRVRVDARKWLLAKRQPKKYGDKIDVTSGGEKLREMDEVSIAARTQALISQALARGEDAA